MGARHMSALETSTREEVVATITLSEEDGRVTVFTDGTFEDSLATSL
ncbi:Diadenylate cyclase (plasmid) [Haloferax volcanii]|nr:Diadenylate cyclase [Haloferax lucentense]